MRIGVITFPGTLDDVDSTRIGVWMAAMIPTVLLALAVVFTGNHFLFDIVAGVAVSLAALLAAYIVTPSTAGEGHDERATSPARTSPPSSP